MSSKYGFVISTKMAKTVRVRVERIKLHPLVKKELRVHSNVMAHDPTLCAVNGDFVRIDPCRKISKHKNYVVGEIVKPASRYVDSLGFLHTQAPEGPFKGLVEMDRKNQALALEKLALEKSLRTSDNHPLPKIITGVKGNDNKG